MFIVNCGIQSDTKKVIFADNLMPMSQSTKKAATEYALHISKFDPDVNISVIVEHVMQNTTIIDPEDFIVEKLGNSGADFATFKISTYTNELKEEIKEIWAPHYNARDFFDKRHKNIEMQRNVNKYKMNNVDETPRYNNNNKHRQMRSESGHNNNAGHRRHTPTRQNMRRSSEYRRHSPARENTRYGAEYRGQTPSRENVRDYYGTPKRKSNGNESNVVTKPTSQPTTQYIYIPCQQPMPMYQQSQPTFLGQPQGQQNPTQQIPTMINVPHQHQQQHQQQQTIP